MLPQLIANLLLLLVCPASAQAASSTVPFAPMIIVALILSLMAAALLVVTIVVCHFAWFRRTATEHRRETRKQPRPQPSTIPKGKTVIDAPLQRPETQKKPVEPRLSSVADPLYINVDIPEPTVQTASIVRSQPPGTEMRHTASQFLEFLSRKWNMEQHHDHPQHQPLRPTVTAQLTTFKPSTSTKSSVVVSPRQIETQIGDESFDVCEQDVGQYDNLTMASTIGGREADRYEVAMELRDTRRSRASTPGVSGRDSETEGDLQQQQEQEQQELQQQPENARYDSWFEEVSEAL
ncbi:hypothetical protein BOX15_Mlig018361g1 [Macrostomum lignano]|uniref:Uncharacterized protein n=1 Tax=Macrostomum lignano TaxID=282301 RepID=A0A267DKU0_9PLAT|nr:hypothetical protein BOX15_Mlig018361g1 [Macrostomum lignano]